MRPEKNKWLKYRYLKKSKRLTRYVPETRIMNSKILWRLISKYHSVIVKPVYGSRGRGVIQVSAKGSDQYLLHYENVKVLTQGKEETYAYLKSITGLGRYMVQRTISRPTVNGRPFDMRVIVQRKTNSHQWKVTAKLAKVAGKGYIVSNITRSRGRLLSVGSAIRKSSINHLSANTLQSKMDKISRWSARRLSTLFPRHRIYGLDIAFDRHGRPWIIEANLYPAMSHFLKYKNRTMYRRIMAYKYS